MTGRTEVGRNLIREMLEGKIKPIVGREREISLMIETLCRETKSNPVLVGEAGVGKTALAEALAERIYRGQVPDKLRDCRLYSVSASDLIAGCNWYGMIEKRVTYLIEEAKRDDVILFIDEIHTIVGTSPESDSTRDIGQQLKPALARGDIKLIGATTDREYRRFIERDEALERRFTPIQVPELSSEQTFVLLKKLAKHFRQRKKIEISGSVLRLVLSYAERFLRNRHFPDKAIDLLEQTVAFAEANDKSWVTEEEAEEVVRKMIGVPANLSWSLHNLEDGLKRKKLLDENLAKQFCGFLRVSMQGFSVSSKRPNAVIFLPGKTAEKTESLAKIIAEEIFDDKKRVVKINFGELTDRWEFNQMMGIGGGRVSQESPITKISKMPWCVIVCENLESSRQSVQEIWAKAIENGFLIDADNKKVYLSDAIIILSADIPASFMNKPGFNTSENEVEDVAERLEKFFSKSLIKFSDFIVFDNESDAPHIRRRWLKEVLHEDLSKRFARQGIHLRWDETVIENLLQKLEAFDHKQDWEKCVNILLLPALLPFLKRGEKQISVSIKCENEKIVVDSEELPDKDKTERIRIEEVLKHGLYEKVKWWLTEHYQLENENDRSTLTASDGITQTKIYFSIWKDQLLLSFLTPIADKIDAENLPYILEKNMNLRFGKFAVESDGNVFFEYSMLGNNCSEKNFRSVFQNFVETAGKYKKELKKRETAVLTSQWFSDEAVEWLESNRIKR